MHVKEQQNKDAIDGQAEEKGWSAIVQEYFSQNAAEVCKHSKHEQHSK